MFSQVTEFTVVLERLTTLGPSFAIRGPESMKEWIINWFEAAAVDREIFGIVLLDTSRFVIGLVTVAMGTLDNVTIHPREIFKAAILANAAEIILFHNHPSKDPTPSQLDREATKGLVEAGNTLGIPVIDHVIVATGAEPMEYRSFVETGLMPTAFTSEKTVINDVN